MQIVETKKLAHGLLSPEDKTGDNSPQESNNGSAHQRKGVLPRYESEKKRRPEAAREL